jgi:hypothetical protein
MLFPESEVLLDENPELDEQIERLDKFLGTREPSESMNIDLASLTGIINIPIETLQFLIEELCKKGVLRKKYCVYCKISGSIIDEVDIKKIDNLNIPCTECDSEHILNKENVVERYEITKFPVRTHNSEVTVKINGMKLLEYISKDMNKPFSNKRFLILLHFLMDLLPFLDGCEKLGLNPTETVLFYKRYPYPKRDEIIKELEGRGYIIAPIERMQLTLKDFQNRCDAQKKDLIIIEDGGQIVPEIHKNFPKTNNEKEEIRKT